jgi:hypothetical protein
LTGFDGPIFRLATGWNTELRDLPCGARKPWNIDRQFYILMPIVGLVNPDSAMSLLGGRCRARPIAMPDWPSSPAHFLPLLIGVLARCECGFYPADRRVSIGYDIDIEPAWAMSMKFILGIVATFMCAAVLVPSIADARGSGGGGHSSGHSSIRSYTDSEYSDGNSLSGAPAAVQTPDLSSVVTTQGDERGTDSGVRDDAVILTNLGAETEVESKGAESSIDVGGSDEQAE